MSITFEDIKKANESIVTPTIERKDKKTGKVKTKEYSEVNQRVKAFRMVYPNGFIETELEDFRTEMIRIEDYSSKEISSNVCRYKATVGYYENGVKIIIGIGSAEEKEQASMINRTSYIENCETSAVGRALGFAGFGIDTSICSADELNNALAAQAANEAKQQTAQATKAQNTSQTDISPTVAKISALRDTFTKCCKEISAKTGVTVKDVSLKICANVGVEKPKSESDYTALIAEAEKELKALESAA